MWELSKPDGSYIVHTRFLCLAVAAFVHVAWPTNLRTVRLLPRLAIYFGLVINREHRSAYTLRCLFALWYW